MKTLQVLFISGNWNENEGRPSKYMGMIAELLEKKITGHIDVYNGGNIKNLNQILDDKVPTSNVVFWFPNIPSDIRPSIKKPRLLNQSCTIINYKRNDNSRLKYDSLKSLAISCKADLSCEVYKDDTGRYRMRIFDNQDVIVSDFTQNTTQSINDLVNKIYILRSLTYSKIIRTGDSITTYTPNNTEIINKFTEFGNILKTKSGNSFIKRHLGELAYRGYIAPNSRSYDIVYVSTRQLELADMNNPDSPKFVATRLLSNKINYYGTSKPCFNCSTYNRILNHLPKVNYVFFSPMYVEDAKFTEKVLPSNCLQQVPEIMHIINKFEYTSDFAINLLGCGSLILVPTLDDLDKYYDKLQLRGIPEVITAEYDKIVNDDGVNSFINTLKGRPLNDGELLEILFSDGTASIYKINIKTYKDDQGKLHKEGNINIHIKGIPSELSIIGLSARRV